jgi:hypothetical protein
MIDRRRQQERERIRHPLGEQHARQPVQVQADNVREFARPTARAFLDAIPRIALDPTSNVVREASLQVMMEQGTIPCLLGEFGPMGEHQLRDASLVLCPPLAEWEGHRDCSGILEHLLLCSNQVVAFIYGGGGALLHPEGTHGTRSRGIGSDYWKHPQHPLATCHEGFRRRSGGRRIGCPSRHDQ